jgi:hypothetical protein
VPNEHGDRQSDPKIIKSSREAVPFFHLAQDRWVLVQGSLVPERALASASSDRCSFGMLRRVNYQSLIGQYQMSSIDRGAHPHFHKNQEFRPAAA